MIVTIGTRKGGTSKTTTAVALALLLARRGPTTLVDADPQLSARTWWDRAKADGWLWPDTLTLVEWHDPMTLPATAHTVIDCPPGDPGRFRAALEFSDTAVVPVGARGADIAQLGPTVRDVEAVAAHRELAWAVLLTMVRARTLEATQAPAAIVAAGLPLLDVVIPERADYGRMFATVPSYLGAYVDVLAELEEEPADAPT